MKDTYKKIFKAVKSIPCGKVASYGQIAALLGLSNPRMVGQALANLKDQSVPWWRIVNSQLKISLHKNGGHHILQKKLLEIEGIKFNNSGKIDKKYQLKI